MWAPPDNLSAASNRTRVAFNCHLQVRQGQWLQVLRLHPPAQLLAELAAVRNKVPRQVLHRQGRPQREQAPARKGPMRLAPESIPSKFLWAILRPSSEATSSGSEAR